MLIDEKKVFGREVLGHILEIMGVCLRMYKKTNDEKWIKEYEWYDEKSHIFRA